jgi:probable rRNA maturation factor
MSIKYYQQEVNARLLNKKLLSAFIIQQCAKAKVPELQLVYVFVSDAHLLSMNQQFLSHDTYTDIITFNLCEPSNNVLIGEIYISTDRVLDNAETLQQSYTHELHRVIFHGVLHLLGYNDKSKKQAEVMRAMEDAWLKAYAKYLKLHSKQF